MPQCIFEPVDDLDGYLYCPYCQRYQKLVVDMTIDTTTRFCDINNPTFKERPKGNSANPNLAVPHPRVIPQYLTYGPGSELKKLFLELGIAEQLGCNCNAKARQMDSWGIEGCKKQRARLIKWLEFSSGRYKWNEKIVIAGKLLSKGLLSPSLSVEESIKESCGLIIDEAIRRAEKYELDLEELKQRMKESDEDSKEATP